MKLLLSFEMLVILLFLICFQYLIKCLVHLLTTEPHMQLHAAEVLLSIVSWKAGKAQDRMQLLCLLKTDMIMPLFR